jgi:hypothetical protein
MPYEFSEDEPELEPEASSRRGGDPPRKRTGTDVLDPDVPPEPPGTVPSIPSALLIRVIAVLLLVGLVGAAILIPLFWRR